MKKNTVVYLVIFLALAITATVLLLKRTESTLPTALTNFSVNDTASITRIHLTDHFKNDITLERKGPGLWTVNGKYHAQQIEIQTLLETIKEVKVKNPVPKAARDNVIKDLAVNGIKIEMYAGSNPIKTYYVGSSTANDEGTYMLLQGSSEPFVTYIPGFVGYLTTRYITKLMDWRSTQIFYINPADIKEVAVKYYDRPDQSFRLTATGNTFLLSKSSVDNPGATPEKMNQLLAKKYLIGYRAIDFESFANLTPAESDSILKSRPFSEITVTTITGPMPPLILYAKQADIKTKDVGKTQQDLDRFYGTVGADSKDVVLVQKYVAGKLLATYADLSGGQATILK